MINEYLELISEYTGLGVLEFCVVFISIMLMLIFIFKR